MSDVDDGVFVGVIVHDEIKFIVDGVDVRYCVKRLQVGES